MNPLETKLHNRVLAFAADVVATCAGVSLVTLVDTQRSKKATKKKTKKWRPGVVMCPTPGCGEFGARKLNTFCVHHYKTLPPRVRAGILTAHRKLRRGRASKS